MSVLKKILAITVLLVLILQIIPLSLISFAQEITNQTEDALHITKVPEGYSGIYTKEDLDNVRNSLSGKFILMNDIEFSKADFESGGEFYNDGKGWSPILLGEFTGTFDGNGYAIKNIFINISSSSFGIQAGLFGHNKGTIQNLGMVGGSISATSNKVYVGGIAGENEGTISNCYNTSSISAKSNTSATYTGGIAGYNNKGTINNCYNTGSVSTDSNSAYAGGIVGCSTYYSNGTINNCYNTGSVSVSNTSTSTNFSYLYAGGIMGNGSDTISNCYNTGTVSASISSSYGNEDNFVVAGGIAGKSFGDGTINNCYSTGSVSVSNTSTTSSNSKAGGIVGVGNFINNCYNTGSISGSNTYKYETCLLYVGGIAGYSYETISNCYNTGSINATYDPYKSYVGGIAGENDGTISNCYNTGSISANSSCVFDRYHVEAYAGGIVGVGNTINNCYNTGSVSATSIATGTDTKSNAYAGGIVGYSEDTISNCYNTGRIRAYTRTTDNDYSGLTGGIAGENDGTISNCYYLDNISKGDGSGTAVKLTLNQMQWQSSYEGFDFDTVWGKPTNYLPVLKAFGVVDLNSIMFEKTAIELCWNCSVRLNVISNPTTIQFLLLEYLSQNESIATVDSSGIITGNSIGTTTIRARDKITLKETFCTVNVVQGVRGISITGNNTTGVGHTTQLTATVSPYDAVNKVVKWSSSNTNTAEVDQNGLVTGRNVGTTFITAESTDGTDIKTTFTITVIIYPSSIVLDKSEISLKTGETSKITATISPGDASDKKVVWTSNNTAVAMVDQNGQVTAISRGDAIITAKSNVGGLEATCKITVIQPVTSVSLDTNNLSLGVNSTYQLIATINPGNANNQNVRWESGDTSIATVDAEGNVTAVSKGMTTITVFTEDGNKQAVCVVNVFESVTNIELSETSVNLIEDVQHTLTVESIVPENATNKNVKWTSSNENVAIVDQNGKIIAISEGSAIITATALDGSGVNACCQVNVIAKSLFSISVSTKPTKTTYLETKDLLNTTGGKITLTYDNGTTEVIDIAADMISGFDNTIIGKQTLTVTYSGKTSTFEIEIIAKSLTSISVTTEPTKLTYLEGKDNLDVTGGKITLTYDNGTSQVIALTSNMVTGFDNSKVGKQTLTVTYQGKTTSFEIEIIANVIDADNLGDVNGDGKISILDALDIFKCISGKTPAFTGSKLANSDINMDGKITIIDALCIFKHIAGKMYII